MSHDAGFAILQHFGRHCLVQSGAMVRMQQAERRRPLIAMHDMTFCMSRPWPELPAGLLPQALSYP